MIDFHLIVFLDHQNPGLATKIVSLGSCIELPESKLGTIRPVSVSTVKYCSFVYR